MIPSPTSAHQPHRGCPHRSRLTMKTRMTPAPSRPSPLTPNQIRGFLASWGGWALDGMDSFIYALVLVPAMRDLLPRSGLDASPANLGYYGGLLFALFLVGWGFAFLWGPVGDRFGRVPHADADHPLL